MAARILFLFALATAIGSLLFFQSRNKEKIVLSVPSGYAAAQDIRPANAEPEVFVSALEYAQSMLPSQPAPITPVPVLKSQNKIQSIASSAHSRAKKIAKRSIAKVRAKSKARLLVAKR